ncbi:MAG: toluene tolerance protein [Hirschia sp.]|nr:toluene tolerance protein [Hirschia sp.]MBF18513.1 toluene tolerance protein [Hirschia sp.]|tara:strand:- start:1378 stop:2043 length:666 start_codon:yes stop_codon:yes gene_type:complete
MKMFKRLVATTALAVGLTGAAFADADSEAFVSNNANEVLSTLNQPSLTDEERVAQFANYMDKFANMDEIARLVLGQYGRDLDPEVKARYTETFRRYALAVYESQLDQFRGEEIKIISSQDRKKRRESIVVTEVQAADQDKTLMVLWRLRGEKDADDYRVIDVGLNLDGSILWLMDNQRQQFEQKLSQSRGDVNVIIDWMNDWITTYRNGGEVEGVISDKKS